jgi:MFS family permease
VIWTSGPLLVAVAVAAGSPAAAVLLSALITVGGTIWFANAPVTRRWRRVPGGGRGPSAIANPGLRVMLATTLLMGAGIGAVEVALPAVAVHARQHAAAGLLLGLWSVGSMVGGVTYGSRSWRTGLPRRYPTLLLIVALTSVPLIFTAGVDPAIPLSLLAGVGYAPTLACQYALVGSLAMRGAATEAFAWTSTALVSGIAAGNATAGPLVQANGIAHAFALGCVAFTLAAAVALLSRSRLDRAITHARRVEAVTS